MNADTRQNKLQDDDKHNDPEFVHKAVVVAKLLTYCLIGPLISIYGMLFGPQWTWVFGIAAFIAPVIVMVKSREATGARLRLVCPEGLA